MEALIFLVISLVMMVPLALWDGFVLSKLWLWFIVPVFGLSPLTVAAAIGIGLIASSLTHQMPVADKNQSYTDLLSRQLASGLILPTFMLLFGWIVHSFM